jgi:ADP-ribosylglycohydrolase
MLLELTQGDAYGAGFEYVPDDVVANNNDLSSYRKHQKHAIEPGCYTDDGQMSIANALALLSGKPLTRELLADLYVSCFKRDERAGYAGGFYAFLQSVKDGKEFLARIKPNSDKSGAAMRASVFGILPTVEQVIAATTLQAKLTHDTKDGINAAVAAALMAHYFLYNKGPREQLGKWIELRIAGTGNWAYPWTGKVGEKGWMSVRAAITAIQANDSLSQVLKQCIAYTGDVDTVAAIALAAAAHAVDIKQDLPKVLFDTMENGTYGRDYVIDLDKKLLARKQELEAAHLAGAQSAK